MSPEPKEGTGQCLICTEDVPSVELVDHIRVMHPDVYEPPLTWDDGQRVVIDESEVDEWLGGDSDAQ